MHPFQRTISRLLLAAGLVIATVAAPADARFMTQKPGDPMAAYAPEAMKGIDVDEHLGDTVPLDLPFTDDNGKTVTLRDYLAAGKPVVLQLGYYDCPMLCDLVSRGLLTSLQKVKLDAGTDFQVVSVSIDPKETPDLAARKKQTHVQQYARDGSEAGLHFLTGPDDSIRALADAVGFKYKWIEQAGQYSHPAVIMILTPDGKLARYLYGVTYDPQTLRLSLVEASDGKVGSVMDKFIMTCFVYDGTQGRYGWAAINLLKGAAVLTMLVMGTALALLFRREFKQRKLSTGAI